MPLDITKQDRKRLKDIYDTSKNADHRIRAHAVLLAADGWSERKIVEITFTEADFVADAIRRYKENGVDGLLTD